MIYEGRYSVEGNRVSYANGTEIRAWYCSGPIAAIMIDKISEELFAWPMGGHAFENLGKVTETISLPTEETK